MATFDQILAECCKDGGECECAKKGKEKCKGKCSCGDKKKIVKEAKEAKGLCKQCGIKLSKLSKEEGFCVECATPINEKYESDEAGDAKYHAKKDDDLDKKGACPNCGSTKGFVAGKCLACGDKKGVVKESKFEKYLEESAEPLMEGVMDGELRRKIIAAGVPVPSTVTVDAVNNIKKQLTANGHTDLADQVDGAMTFTAIEQRNRKEFPRSM